LEKILLNPATRELADPRTKKPTYLQACLCAVGLWSLPRGIFGRSLASTDGLSFTTGHVEQKGRLEIAEMGLTRQVMESWLSFVVGAGSSRDEESKVVANRVFVDGERREKEREKIQ
jgi:hypothetical protein